MAVQGACHQLFAGAGFTVDEDRDVRAGKSPDCPEDLLHRRRLTDDLGRLCGLAMLDRPPLVAVTQRPLDLGHGLFDIEGLRKIFERATIIGRDGAVEIRVRGHDDDRYTGVAVTQVFQQRNSVSAGHPDVRQDHVGLVEAQQRPQDRVCALEASHVHFRFAQRLLEDPSDRTIIIDDPNPSVLCHLPFSKGNNTVNTVSPGLLEHSINPW